MLARTFLFSLLCLIVAGGAFATDDVVDSDWGHVEVNILPTVRVTYLGGDIFLGDANALEQICATLEFEVHANGQDIAMMCGASYLWKDDEPSSEFYIPVDQSTEAVITASYGEFHSGLPILMDPFDMGVFGSVDIYHTEYFEFGSGDPGTWSYNVTVYICWQGDDAELFQGDYSGGVVLWSMYLPI